MRFLVEPSAKLNSRVAVRDGLNDSLKAKNLIAKFRERRPNDLTVETIGGAVVYFARSPGEGQLPENFRIPEPGLMVLGKWLIYSDSREMSLASHELTRNRYLDDQCSRI